jgi:hypothetical protein
VGATWTSGSCFEDLIEGDGRRRNLSGHQRHGNLQSGPVQPACPRSCLPATTSAAEWRASGGQSCRNVTAGRHCQHRQASHGGLVRGRITAQPRSYNRTTIVLTFGQPFVSRVGSHVMPVRNHWRQRQGANRFGSLCPGDLGIAVPATPRMVDALTSDGASYHQYIGRRNQGGLAGCVSGRRNALPLPRAMEPAE